ncbi:hypothetical protein Y032_0407g911 [Ancylostoma ceylanicum]|uniref:Uncharacterized protein n=1 Tax=Ancylostoma ceylanicum TaxID=53326 RepID=A0A016X231_9BILA|nr:hypothetical protein Y032_0407g911 [Ancylostoma ceylanicum]
MFSFETNRSITTKSKSSTSGTKSRKVLVQNLSGQKGISDIEKTLESAEDVVEVQWPGETKTDVAENESRTSTFFEAMVLSGLTFSTDSVFSLPLNALAKGGCVGVAIVALTALNQHATLYNGYYLGKHLTNIIDDQQQIVDCKGKHVSNGSNCLSSFNDKQCSSQASGGFFINGNCTTRANYVAALKTENFVQNAEIATFSYTKNLLKEGKENVASQIIAAQHIVIFVAFCVGVRILKCALAVIFILVVVFYIAVILLHPEGSIDLLRMLYQFSNPSSLFKAETYLTAMRESIASFGLCVFGLFCASSFRRKEGRSHQITRIIFWSNMLVSLLSTIAMVIMLSYNQGAGHSLFTSMRTNMPGLRFALASVPEHFARFNYKLMTLILYYCGPLLMNVSSSFGVVFVMKAVLRDFLPDFNVLFGWVSMALFCCSSAAYYILVTLNFAHEDTALETYVVDFTKYFFIGLNVIIFVHIYGIHDFEVDVVSVLGERQGWLSFFNPSWSLEAYTYSIVAVMVLQVIECNRMLGWLQFRWLYDEAPVVEEMQDGALLSDEGEECPVAIGTPDPSYVMSIYERRKYNIPSVSQDDTL